MYLFNFNVKYGQSVRYLRKRGKLCDNHEFVRVFNSNLYFYNDVIYIRRYVNGISVANAFYSQTRRVFLFANVSNFYSNCSKYNITHNAKRCNREPPYKHILYEFMVRTSIHVYVCIYCAYIHGHVCIIYAIKSNAKSLRSSCTGSVVSSSKRAVFEQKLRSREIAVTIACPKE